MLQQSGNVIVRNLTLSLLSLCTMGIGWIAKEVVDLDERVARIEAITSVRSDQETKMQDAQDKQLLQISDLNDRIIRLEMKAKH